MTFFLRGKGQVLVKRSGASGLMVETERDFGLGATSQRLLARPGPFKALARTGKVAIVMYITLCQSLRELS